MEDEAPEDAKGAGDRVPLKGLRGSSEEREQARQELALVSCWYPRAGYPEILRNVTLATTEAEHS